MTLFNQMLDHAIKNKLVVRLILDVPNDSWPEVTTGIPVTMHFAGKLVELKAVDLPAITFIVVDHIVALQYPSPKEEKSDEATTKVSEPETTAATTKSRR
jgi:hypothetical protein